MHCAKCKCSDFTRSHTDNTVTFECNLCGTTWTRR
jgi:hypothetical protein